MRSLLGTVKTRLTAMASAILNAKYGYWIAIPIASALLTLLVVDYQEPKIPADSTLNVVFSAPGQPLGFEHPTTYCSGGESLECKLVIIQDMHSGDFISGTEGNDVIDGANGRDGVDGLPGMPFPPAIGKVSSGYDTEASARSATDTSTPYVTPSEFSSLNELQMPIAIMTPMANQQPVTPPPPPIVKGVLTKYSATMKQNGDEQVASHVIDDVFCPIDYIDGATGMHMLGQQIGAEAAYTPAKSATTKNTMLMKFAAHFKPDAPISIVAELDAATFEKQPAEPQRILFTPDLPMQFSWNVKPLGEGEQDMTVKLFMEGIPVNGTEPQLIPIYTATLHTYVSVPLISRGSPIALYASINLALLAFVTWGWPLVVGLAGRLFRKKAPGADPKGANAATMRSRGRVAHRCQHR